MPSPLISYASVAKTFDGGRVVAVDDVSLDVAEGEFLAIVGGSGSGKTTLLRLANRLIEADRGTVTVEGEDIAKVDPIGLRRRIGYVFQNAALFPHIEVAGNIGITPKLLGTPADEIAGPICDTSRSVTTMPRNAFARPSLVSQPSRGRCWRCRDDGDPCYHV